MRPEIRFSSAFPDDSVEDEGDFVQCSIVTRRSAGFS